MLRRYSVCIFSSCACNSVSAALCSAILAFSFSTTSAGARATGVTESDVSRGLAQLLPEMVDRVTPEGKMPDDATLRRNVDDLARQLET